MTAYSIYNSAELDSYMNTLREAVQHAYQFKLIQSKPCCKLTITTEDGEDGDLEVSFHLVELGA